MKITKKHISHFIKAGIFIFLAFIIIYSYPSQTKFKYNFEIGKPWAYGLITAQFNFPIYKSDAQIEKEKTDILKQYTPYYKIDNKKIESKKKEIDNLSVSNKAKSYIYESLRMVYEAGILSATEYNKLQDEDKKEIVIIDENRMTRNVVLSEIYTQKTAYESIISKAGYFLQNELKNVGLNLFLSDNLEFDKNTSELTKDELLSKISLTSGVVQSGERIIDRGEIVNSETYRLLESLQKAYEETDVTIRRSTLTTVGESILVVLFIVFLYLFFYLFRPAIFNENKHLLLIILLISVMVLLTSFTVKYTDFSIYLVPFALLPIVVRVFFDSDTALYTHIVSTIIVSLIVPIPFEFILLQIAIGTCAVSSLKDMTQRSQLAQTSLWIFLIYSITYIAFHLVSEGNFTEIQWQPFVYFAVSSVLLLLAYALIYVFEKIFGLTSSITLIELTNVNSDLMINFSETASGTFQHSLQVSNLATAAAKKIGANSLLVRTGALYHDIGKMVNSHLFIENQQDNENALLDMDLEEAARNVTNHVAEGIKIAKKQGLPNMVINFIETHHGNGKAKYFYNTFKNRYPDKPINEAAFSYPGPLPNTKETAILMMADTIEACSRSLTIYSEESINEMVEKMIDTQFLEGMFKNAPITFKDVEVVKQVFKEKIKSMYHNRIVYPEIENKEVAENS